MTTYAYLCLRMYWRQTYAVGACCDGNGQHTGQEPLNRVEMTMSQLDVDGFPISWKDPQDADTVSMFDVIYGKMREVCVFTGHVGDVWVKMKLKDPKT